MTFLHRRSYIQLVCDGIEPKVVRLYVEDHSELSKAVKALHPLTIKTLKCTQKILDRGKFSMELLGGNRVPYTNGCESLIDLVNELIQLVNCRLLKPFEVEVIFA